MQTFLNNFHIGGYIRPEFSIGTSDAKNENNTRGNPYNNQLWWRPAFAPDLAYSVASVTGSAPVQNGGSAGTSWEQPFTGLVANYGKRTAPNANNLFHMHYLRFEVESDYKISADLSWQSRLRVISDFGHYSTGSTNGTYLEPDPTGAHNQPTTGGDPALYGGGVNLFAYHAEKRIYRAAPAGVHYTTPACASTALPNCAPQPLLVGYSVQNHPLPLEWSSSNYLAYFPNFFFDYQHGPLSIRLGEQQIAWGQALFFRVLDVPDGLDTRRHLIFDQAAEEFGDKRTPAPSIRVGYQFTDDILADAFAEKFTPTILPNPETPYNLIPDQFTVHDLYDEKKWRVNYGIRLKGNFGNYGLQFIAVRMMNPGGAFRWTQSATVKGLPLNDERIPGVTQPVANEAGEFSFVESALAGLSGGNVGAGGRCTNGNATQCAFGQVFSQTPFEQAASGVYSSNEWFHYAGDVRLNGVTGLNGAIVPFPAAGYALAGPVTGTTPGGGVPYSFDYANLNKIQGNAASRARNELDTFFGASGGGLRGHIAREYFRQTILGGGASYVVQGTPGSVLDQLIINVETAYTPKQTMTDPSLYRTLADPYLRKANWISDLVMEKYFRFTSAFPATYFVFQYEHRLKDDIFGRSLTGYAGSGGRNDTVARRDAGDFADATQISNNVVNQGVGGGSNYFVFAFLQPFPQAIYRFDYAMLCDMRGGCLIQPGIRWKPSGGITIEGFYTYINSRIGGGNPNNNTISTFQNLGNEMTVRLGYQF